MPPAKLRNRDDSAERASEGAPVPLVPEQRGEVEADGAHGYVGADHVTTAESWNVTAAAGSIIPFSAHAGKTRSTQLREAAHAYCQPPAEMVSRLDRGRGVVLDYVGHADITLILIEVDPEWSMTIKGDEHGIPILVERGEDVFLFGAMTIHGVTRPCVGSAKKSKGDLFKELYGDLLRNGAMRFGIGTKLWSKAEGATREEEEKQSKPTGIDPMSVRIAVGRSLASCADKPVAGAVRSMLSNEFGTTKLIEIPDDRLLELWGKLCEVLVVGEP
jgi:hypothetical protein